MKRYERPIDLGSNSDLDSYEIGSMHDRSLGRNGLYRRGLQVRRKRISRTNYKTGDVCDVKSAKICGKAMLFHVSRSRSSVLQLEFVENIMHMVLHR